MRCITTLFISCLVALWATGVQALPVGVFSWTDTLSPATLPFTGQWEDVPAGTENTWYGDDRIRQLKFNVRIRSKTETCFDSTVNDTCETGDTGRSRRGSARTFWNEAAPTALGTADALGISTLDYGRLWVDSDGADNDIATLDDNNQLRGYAGTLGWVNLLAMGANGTTTNDFKLWNGTTGAWATAPLAETTISSGTNTDAINTLVPTTLTTLTGATGTAVIPATGAYLIHVVGFVSIASSYSSVYVGLNENNGTTDTIVSACKMGGNTSYGTGVADCYFNYYKPEPVVGLTYTFTIKIQKPNDSQDAWYNADPAATAGMGIAPKATIQVVRMSKTIPQGF